MDWVIVDSTGVRVRHPRTRRETYSTEASALAARTRYLRAGRVGLKVITAEEYAVSMTKVQVTNLISGRAVFIDKDQVGGPCDPSTERYWSM